MFRESEVKTSGCLTDEITAYLDGELSLEEEHAVDEHLRHCPACSAKLNAEKRLIGILSGSLDNENLPEPPVNFVRRVSVFAESRMDALRLPAELAVAGGIVLFLTVLSVAVFGVDIKVLLAAAYAFVEKLAALGSVVAGLVYNIAFGIVRATKAVSHGFSFETILPAVILAITFAGMFLALYIATTRRSPSSKV